ncbi:MAG TPA: ACT domain-containing protein [Solirubrobacteraceae bacterium]|nr:ACT domain-containing protein [Solirubrobacteraceae bacterium]
MTAGGLDLRVLPGALAVARLHPDEPPPAWAAPAGALHALVRTAGELSIVCADQAVPPGVRAERGFRAIAVAGPLDFGLTGVLAALAVPLAEAGVPIFAVSTYDTDHLLVRAARLDAAIAALRAAGHRVDASRPAS